MVKRHELILSVKEARKILGPTYDKYSDEYIEQLIINFDGIIEAFIKTVPKY
jgi:hypothetical protein